ncbi:MAG: hypothetical protein KGN34_00285 [Sphingomonadales bacterium]|nr:hypothetical protein [Sphingomonadales bacterium]
MNRIGKSLLGTVATATLALGATAPASAQAWNGPAHDSGWHDGNHRDSYRDNYRMGGNPRFAIEQCSRAATMQARGQARVTRISDVDRTGDGFRVRGELAVSSRGDYRDAYRWGGHDRGGWDRGRDHGSFTCRIDHGRVVDLDLHGMRG